MSNYTFVLADRFRRERIEAWLRNHGCPDTELERRGMPFGWTLFIVAADVAAHVRGDVFFRGTCVAPELDAMVLDVEGWQRSPGPVHHDPAGLGGEFVTARWSAGEVRVDRDVFGGVTLAYSRAPGVMIASDSLLLIADLRRHLGAPVTANDEVLAARTVRSGHATQQMSPETQVREIRIVPVGQHLVLRTGVFPALQVGGPILTERLFAPRFDHAELVHTLAARVAGVVRATAIASAGAAELGLSGGYDSRLVLAGARISGTLDGYRVISSNSVPSHAPDFAVASELAERFGFALNRRGAARHRTDLPGAPLAIWGSTHLGVYDRLLPSRPRRLAGYSVTLSGLGAEILKGNWGWQPIDTMVDGFRVTDLQRTALVAQIDKALRSVGADSAWRDASELYYLAHRNGVHGTGHISTNMTQVRPLQMLEMARLGHTAIDGRRRIGGTLADLLGSYRAIGDMLTVLDPELAGHRYDRRDKAISAASIRERLSRLGGPIDASEVPDVVVYGTLVPPAGASQLGIVISEKSGLGGLMETAHVLAMGEAMLARAPAGVADLYAQLLALARHAMTYRKLPPASSGSALPKVLSLALLG